MITRRILVGGVLGFTLAVGNVVPALAASPAGPTTITTNVPVPATMPASADAPSTAGLEEALRRDAGISLEDYVAQGAQAQKASDLSSDLKDKGIPATVSLDKGQIVVSSDAPAARDMAATAGAVSAPAKVTTSDFASSKAALDAYLAEVGPDGLLGVVEDKTGYVILVAQPDEKKNSNKAPAQFAAEHRGVRVQPANGPAAAVADTDVLGGQGIRSGNAICSAGFVVYDGAVNKQVLATAGHCRDAGDVYPGVMSQEPAMTGNRASQANVLGYGAIGQYNWSDFGTMLGNNFGYDLATIPVTNSVLKFPATVTTWKSSFNGASTVPVTGYIADPTVLVDSGIVACRSGRTTGWQCGKINYYGWVAVRDSAGKIHYVNSVGANMYAAPGDSGGAMLVGYKALGITSATGGTDATTYFTSAAPVADLLKIKPGYSLKTWLGEPKITSVSNQSWASGTVVKGNVPLAGAGDTIESGTQLNVKLTNGWATTVPVGRTARSASPTPGRPRPAGPWPC